MTNKDEERPIIIMAHSHWVLEPAILQFSQAKGISISSQQDATPFDPKPTQ